MDTNELIGMLHTMSRHQLGLFLALLLEAPMTELTRLEYNWWLASFGR